MRAWAAATFPTLSRHWQVLRISWRMQDEAEKTRRPISDHEFLPAALEIMEKPPSPGLRWLLLILCTLFTIAILWSAIGKVDVVAVASGKIIPSANVKIIQPIEIGSVRAIHVRNGQHVTKGQLLVELDPTLAGADEAQAGQQLLSANIVKARNDALLSYLVGHSADLTAPAGTPEVIARTQAQFVSTSIAEYEAQRASLVQQRAQQAAELASAQAEIAKLRMTLPLVDRQLEARKELSDKGYFSKLKMMEYEQLRLEHIQNIAVQEASAEKARASMGALDAEIAKLREGFAKGAVIELSEATDKSALAEEELRKSVRRRAFQQLRAPVSGTVQQLALATIGGVVQPAQPLMVIVPDGSDVEVEAQILNKDIGFVREGQKVRVKLEAYPFTDYGLIEGTVATISRDAIDQNQQGAQRDEKNRPIQPGLVYAARIRLHQRTIKVAGKDQPIGPGLAVQAEIKTGERRIIQYLLSPIAQAMDEAGREMSRRACHLTMMDKNSLCKWNNMVDRVGKILQHFVQSGPAELAARRVARIPDEVGDRVRQLSMRQQLLRLIPATLAILALSACASSEYMGISLRPGGAAAELQDLARRAQAGDRAAQFELADRFEHGQGVTQDLYSASRLRNAHKVISRSVWIYSPNFGVGSQPNVAAVDVPSNVPAYSSKSSDSVGAMTNPSSLISSKSFTVHLEIEAIVDVIADYIRIKDKRKISPHDLIVDIVKAGQKANLTTEDVISQEILFIKKECKNSEFYSDDLKNIFHRYVCNDKNSKFIVLNISDHNSSKLFSNGIISRETFLRYLDRRDNFTVEKMKKTLIGVGFDYLETIRLSQAYPHLPVPPDAQSLFVHRSGVPLITVQHPVDHGQIKNKDRSLPVPAVQRLSLFFPAGE